MSTGTVDRLPAYEDSDVVSELMLKLRVAEVCRQAWRVSQHAHDKLELAEVVAADVTQTLGLSAAAVWELDRRAGVWRLMGCAGDLDVHASRPHLAAVRLDTKASGSDIIDTLRSDVQRLLETTDQHRTWVPRNNVVAVSLNSHVSGNLRALMTWSERVDECLHLVAVESIAQDLAQVFDVVEVVRRNALSGRSFNVLFENLPCAIAGIDHNGRCTRWNDAATQLFGWDHADVSSQPLRFIAPACRESFQATVELCREQVKPCDMRLTCQAGTGETLQTDVLCLPVIDRDAQSEVLIVISDESLNDVRQRLCRAEAGVASLLSTANTVGEVSQQLLESICRRLNWYGGELWQLSADRQRWICTAVWRQVSESSGMAVQPGGSLRNDSGLLGRVNATKDIACADGNEGTFDLAIPIVCDGEVEAAMVCLGAQCNADDEVVRTSLNAIAYQIGHALSRERILENLQKAEENLQQTRKMEAIGMLAGGIAHDFNNLIMVILSNCEMLQIPTTSMDQRADMIDEIRTVGERAATLTRKLLSFSRKRSSEPEALSPTRLLKECENMLERLAVGDIVVESHVPDGVHAIRIDPIEFEQLLLNLVANARDAMPDGGRITITLANVSLTARDVLAFQDARAGDYVELSVADTGCGMDQETRTRAFEPFFTTKEQDKGTGLGLATVYGITRRNHGIIKIESSPGQGTRFSICFPRASIGIKPRQIHALPRQDPRGSETLLIVDDEDAVRRIIQRILEVHGYKVLAADSGSAALKLLRPPQQTCDLLLTDVMMPQMKGTQLAEEARKLRKELPIVFMSGYYGCAESLNNSNDSPLLVKPFSSDVLVQTVRQALDRRTFHALG